MTLTASVIITTKNRKEDLRTALASVAKQTTYSEVIVVNDGSTDGTPEMVNREFPTVRLVNHTCSAGLIVRRNEAAQLASGDILFSLDDDAAFSTPYIIAQTLEEFSPSSVGAVAIPYIEPHNSSAEFQRAPSHRALWVIDSYIGTSHALRRRLFLTLGGYRVHLFHQGEEMDYCIRMLNAGYVVRMGTADSVHHFESPRRDFARRDYYGRRNDILFAWHNVPQPYFPLHILATTANGLMAGLRSHRPVIMLRGLLAGYAAMLRYCRHRRPVTAGTYRLARLLKTQGPRQLDTIDAILMPATREHERWRGHSNECDSI